MQVINVTLSSLAYYSFLLEVFPVVVKARLPFLPTASSKAVTKICIIPEQDELQRILVFLFLFLTQHARDYLILSACMWEDVMLQ